MATPLGNTPTWAEDGRNGCTDPFHPARGHKIRMETLTSHLAAGDWKVVSQGAGQVMMDVEEEKVPCKDRGQRAAQNNTQSGDIPKGSLKHAFCRHGCKTGMWCVLTF